MSIATIICTMNRPDELDRALRSVDRCHPKPTQVLISDDSPESDRRSEKVCADRSWVRYQRGPRRGLAANRNAALAVLPSVDWIHFIDDDVVVSASFYASAAVACDDPSKPVVITGHEINWQEGGVATTIRPPRSGFWGYLEPAKCNDANCVVINATLFPRSLFDVAAFDERLRYGCEEIDISRQAILNDFAIKYEPSLYVDHYPSPLNREIYRTSAIASAIYAGLKHQMFHRRRPLATAAFAAVVIPRMFAHHIRRQGVGVIPHLLGQTYTGIGYLTDYCKSRSERLSVR